MVGVDELAAELGVDVGGDGPVVRLDATADVIGALVERDIEPGSREEAGGIQSGDARADDGDPDIAGGGSRAGTCTPRVRRRPSRSGIADG